MALRSIQSVVWSLALAFTLLASSAQALETELFGSLAVALEPEVAKQLELTDEQQEALWKLVDRREQEGMAAVMRYANSPREERIQKLAPFRKSTEEQALKLLQATQREKLKAIVAVREDAALRDVDFQEEPTEKQSEPTTPKQEPTTVDVVVTDEPTEPIPDPVTPLLGQGRAPDGKVSFNFRNQPWSDVLEWFAERAGLSLVIDSPPPGVLNYRDDREYDAAEALDVLNGVLLTKGYTLVRKDRMLLVINLEDAVPPNVVTDVPLEELDERGEYELIRVLFRLRDSDPEGVAEELRRLIGPQGSVVVLPVARMLQVTETAGRIRIMKSVVEAAELAAEPMSVDPDEVELRVYATEGADPESTLKVLQTLMAESPVARLAVDELTGNLIALATLEEHRAIRAALDRLQQDGRRVELIQVQWIEPASAAIIVNRLFNPGADRENPNPNAPVVEPDRASNALLVRGTSDQVRQIRDLIERLDAAEPLDETIADGFLRTVPLSATHAQTTLEQLQKIWPTISDNPLRIVPPPDPIPVYRPGAELDALEETRLLEQLFRLREEEEREAGSEDNRSTRQTSDSRFRFANETTRTNSDEQNGAPPILIVPGPGSTVIASEDAEALDLVEQIIAALGADTAASDRQFAVFYLKYADAVTATTMLQAIFGGESSGDNLIGDLTGAAIGGEAGGLFGDLLGMGTSSSLGGFSALGVDLVPDVRLNALIVSATPEDLETINQLLRVIDSPRGPDRIEASGRTRLIQVENAPVEKVATVVRQVFADRIASGGASGEPSPQEFFRALRGGGKTSEDQEPEKMSIGIDERSNSLIVRSSAPLYEEVLALVEQLDSVEIDTKATRIVSIQQTNADALRQTLMSLLGENARIAGQTTTRANGQQTPAAQPGAAQPDAAASERERRQREAMQGLQQMREMQEIIRRANQQRRERQEGQRGRGGRGQRGNGGPPAR